MWYGIAGFQRLFLFAPGACADLVSCCSETGAWVFFAPDSFFMFFFDINFISFYSNFQ